MERAKSISKSMISYLKRAREHKEFLLKETREFDRGKRHLANIMGLDAKEMTQNDIDDAIGYLFPVGLFDKRARPMMKHPDLLYKAQKDAQFDAEGRPHHYLFYTIYPNYYETLGDLQKSLRDLNRHEDEQLALGVLSPPPEAKYPLAGRQWLEVEKMRDKLLEPIYEEDYQYLIRCLNHLADHPYSNRAKEVLDKYAHELAGRSINLRLPEIIKDETTGQIYTEMVTHHKETNVRVKTILNGSGKFSFNDDDILYFKHPYIRTGILFPLSLTGMQDRVDVIAHSLRMPRLWGEKSIAMCIRYALSFSLAAYVDPETRERMRLAGLLKVDFRKRERKKFGQAKARRKYTWKKR